MYVLLLNQTWCAVVNNNFHSKFVPLSLISFIFTFFIKLLTFLTFLWFSTSWSSIPETTQTSTSPLTHLFLSLHLSKKDSILETIYGEFCKGKIKWVLWDLRWRALIKLSFCMRRIWFEMRLLVEFFYGQYWEEAAVVEVRWPDGYYDICLFDGLYQETF